MYHPVWWLKEQRKDDKDYEHSAKFSERRLIKAVRVLDNGFSESEVPKW